MNFKFIEPKFIQPNINEHLIKRPRLHSFINQIAIKKITIVRAPAGYGKTSLVLQLLHELSQPVAWVSLDEKDDDITRFWSNIMKSLEHATRKSLFYHLYDNLKGNNTAKNDFLLNAVLAELVQLDHSIHIVLDDFHFIKNAKIHEMMTYFIGNLPSHIHVFITTRVLPPFPLAKWHMKQWVQEIQTEQLKFTATETKQFLATENNWALNEHELAQITKKTEGWVAGLQLISIHSHQMQVPYDWVESPFVSQFLMEEILQNLSSDIRQFLYKTSLLHQLEPIFCREFTGFEDSDAVLAMLEEKGIFTVRLQSANTIYRYHHLFQEVLQKQLRVEFSKEEVHRTILHAANLYENNGDYHQAIELALLSEEYKLAEQWLEKYLAPFLKLSEMDTFMRWLEQLRMYLDKVSIELLIVGYSHAITSSNVSLANTYMKELDQQHEQDGWMSHPENNALASIYIRTKAYYYIAIIGDNDAAMQIAMQQLEKSYHTTDRELLPMVYNPSEYTLLRTPLAGKGRIPGMHEWEAILHLFTQTEYSKLYVSKFGTGVMAEVFFERFSDNLAQVYLEEILNFGIEKQEASLIVPMFYLKTNIFLSRGQIAAALGTLQYALEIVDDPFWKTILHIMQSNCYIEEMSLEKASFILETKKLQIPLWGLTQVKLLLAKQQSNEALKIIYYIKVKAKKENQIATIIQASIYESLCYLELQQKEHAYTSFKDAILIAAKHYYARTILEHEELSPLLVRFKKELRAHTIDTVDLQEKAPILDYLSWLEKFQSNHSKVKPLLSQRELEIFDYLCQGLTNAEIGEALGLSEGTVRTYLSTIYRKLDVKSRAKAILMKDY